MSHCSWREVFKLIWRFSHRNFFQIFLSVLAKRDYRVPPLRVRCCTQIFVLSGKNERCCRIQLCASFAGQCWELSMGHAARESNLVVFAIITVESVSECFHGVTVSSWLQAFFAVLGCTSPICRTASVCEEHLTSLSSANVVAIFVALVRIFLCCSEKIRSWNPGPKILVLYVCIILILNWLRLSCKFTGFFHSEWFNP